MRIPFVLVVLGACSESGSRPPCQPVQLARAEVWGAQLAVDDAFVYWSEHTTGRLMRAARPNGAPALLDAPFLNPTGGDFQSGMVAVAGSLHWTGVSDGQLAIFSTSPDGITTRRVLGCFGPRLVAEAGVVFANGCDQPIMLVMPPDAAPTSPNLAGFAQGIVGGDGGAQVLVNQSLRSIAPDGTQTVLVPTTFGIPVARDADTIFLAEGASLLAVPAAGGTPTMIAELPGPIDITSGAADATHVYVKTSVGGSENDLFAVPRDGNEPRFLATVRMPSTLLATDEGVYWSTIGAPSTGGGVFQLDRCAYD